MSALPDGEHDVFIIDATADDTAAATGVTPAHGDGPVWVLDLTVVSGPHKGEMVTVRASNLGGDEFNLMGMPATLTVTDGNPDVRVDH